MTGGEIVAIGFAVFFGLIAAGAMLATIFAPYEHQTVPFSVFLGAMVCLLVALGFTY